MLTLPATPRVRYTLRNDDFHSITECLSGQIIWEVSLGFLRTVQEEVDDESFRLGEENTIKVAVASLEYLL